jgi:hypothetical protein
MIEKFCIVVDNEPQDAILEKTARILHGKGMKLTYEQLNPSEEKFLVKDSEGEGYHISIDKIKEELNTPRYLRRKVNLLACDYELKKDAVINGFDVILAARELRFSQHSILYSGGLRRVVNGIFDGQGDFSRRIDKLTQLVKAQTQFILRDNYDDAMIKLLGTDNIFDFNSELEELLFQFPEKQFLGEFSQFHEQNFNDLAVLLRDSNNPRAHEFKKEFIERAFSIMIDLNTPQ